MTKKCIAGIFPPQQALVAQSVEHLHGKEGVSGSSPLEGSTFNSYKSKTFKSYQGGDCYGKGKKGCNRENCSEVF